MLKKILFVVVIIFVAIQFYRPARNMSKAVSTNDITNVHPPSSEVNNILQKACNDCHSNNSYYPWYTNIQPFGMWIQDHIDEGKSELNFSEFKTYTAKRQAKKMHEIEDMIEENEMPLYSYTIIHRNAKLTAIEKQQLIAWAKAFQPTVLAKQD
jgi:hypothetical protein